MLRMFFAKTIEPRDHIILVVLSVTWDLFTERNVARYRLAGKTLSHPTGISFGCVCLENRRNPTRAYMRSIVQVRTALTRVYVRRLFSLQRTRFGQ